MTTYKIVRYYANKGRRRTIRGGLTLEQARAWCANPDTSSKSTMPQARRITRLNGPWFDGYTVEQ